MNFGCLWIFVGKMSIVQYEMTLDGRHCCGLRRWVCRGKVQVGVPALPLTRYLAPWDLVALPYPTYSTGLLHCQLGESSW